MKAIVQDRYGPAEVLEVGERPTPSIGDEEVLVRVYAAGIDRGVWHFMTGQPYVFRLFAGLRRPRNPVRGMDLAGRVEAVGAKVTRFQPGDEVFGAGSGSFAEFAAVPEKKLWAKPTRLSFEQAAAIAVSGCTALAGLREVGKIQAGQRVLIVGASGGVGSYAIQVAKASGAEVTAVCGPDKEDLVRTLGADHVLHYTRDRITDGPHRYDLILDIAGRRPLAELRRALTPRGTLVLTGGEKEGQWLGVDRPIRASLLAPFARQRLTSVFSAEKTDRLRVLAELIEAGQVTPAIDRVFPFEETPAAVRYFTDGKARGKVVVAVSAPGHTGS